MNRNVYTVTRKCDICDKEIELQDAYSPTRYEIDIIPNAQIAMPTKTDVYKFVCKKCAEEIKQSIYRIKHLKSTETQFIRFYRKVELEED